MGKAKLSEFDVLAISESILTSVSQILFDAGAFKIDLATGKSDLPKPIEDAVRSIEMQLSRLSQFIEE